jgi:tetratricopeptide (TPR) repeat protein
MAVEFVVDMQNQSSPGIISEGIPSTAPLIHYRRLMRRKTVKRLAIEKALNHLADLIDTALDSRQRDGLTHALKLGDELRNRKLTGRQSIMLHYFLGNAWSNLRAVERAGTVASWNWEQNEIEQEVTNFRIALNNPEFGKTVKYRRCQLLTNLGNLMNHVGRFVEAQEYWNRALQIMPDFGMCLGNRGSGLYDYARSIPRRHDSILMIDEAQRMLSEALRSPMIRRMAREYFAQRQFGVEALQERNRKGKHKFNWYRSLGAGKNERHYRRWCLEKRLFLNYLNDMTEQPCAGGDNVILPSLTRPVGEGLHFEGLYNQLKQEFISSRYLYFQATTSTEVHFSDKRVVLYNTLDHPSYSLAVEKVKAAYRVSYSIFDKVAFFLNSYLELGIDEKLVTFRTFWYRDRQKKRGLRPEFETRRNWPLRGLFWLSKDLFEDTAGFREAIEPDGQELKSIRDHIEHKYLKVLEFGLPPFMREPFRDRLAFAIPRQELYNKTIRLLQMARSALIYLSVAVHWEERQRDTERPAHSKIAELHLKTFEEEWKF